MKSSPFFSALLITLSLGVIPSPGHGQGFKFSNDESAAKDAEAKRADQLQSLLATPCRDKIKNQKIMVLMGEQRESRVYADQSNYNAHVTAVNQRLQALGLKTFTQGQIRAQVAQAEIDAYFKNDPDAAISASKRLAAQYVLRGVIGSSAFRNAMVNVNQVSISMNFTLTGANGKVISQTSVKNASYAGTDVGDMALTLINESAEEVVARLYSDYCQRAGVK